MTEKVQILFNNPNAFCSQNPIAILATGPSVLKTYNDSLKSKYAHVLGVNVIVDHFDCDYWIFADPDTIKKAKPKCKPKLFIAQKVLLDSVASDMVKQYEFSLVEKELNFSKTKFVYTSPVYSIEMALILAKKLQSNDVTLYGVDRAGPTDCNGDTSGNRSERRWATERVRWPFWINWFRDQRGGAKIRYIQN